MQERQEFLDRYFVFAGQDWEPPRDYTRTNGLVEDIRQSYFVIEEQLRLEEESQPRERREHVPSEPIELPGAIRAHCRRRVRRRQARRRPPRRRTAGAAARRQLPAAAPRPRRACARSPPRPAAPPPPAPQGELDSPIRINPIARSRERRADRVSGSALIEQRALGKILVRHGVVSPRGARAALRSAAREGRRARRPGGPDATPRRRATWRARWPPSAGSPFVDAHRHRRGSAAVATRLPIAYAKKHKLARGRRARRLRRRRVRRSARHRRARRRARDLRQAGRGSRGAPRGRDRRDQPRLRAPGDGERARGRRRRSTRRTRSTSSTPTRTRRSSAG